MQVKFLTDVTTGETDYSKGNVYDIPKTLADSFVQTGWAEAFEPPEPEEAKKRVYDAEGRQGAAKETGKIGPAVRK